MEHFLHALAIFVLCTAVSECRQGLYPNVPLQDLTETPEFTQPGVLFVYNWSVDDQALCPGTVTALEYCYQISISSDQENRIIFTLLLLDSLYRIIQTINVTNTTTNCSNRGGIMTCCNRQQLRQNEQFQVPGPNVAGFGIFSETGVDTILAYRDLSIVRSVTGFILNANAVIVNNQIGVSPNQETIIQYRMFNFAIDNSSITPTGGIDLATELTRSTESTNETSDNTGSISDSPDVTSELPTTISEPPTREGPLSTILIIEIVLGCIVVLLFIATTAMWIYMCFKAKALQRKSKVGFETVERNSQLIYESIPEDETGPMVPSNRIMWPQHARNEQQWRTNTPPSIRYNTDISEFVHNPAYGGSILPHTGQATHLETAVNTEQNPAYHSSQEKLF